jgi:hypothetical protein
MQFRSWQLDFGPRTIYEMPKSISNKENSTKCGEKPQTLANKPAELEKRDEVDTTKPKLDGSEASFTPTQPPDVLDNPVFMVEKAVNKKLRNLVKREVCILYLITYNFMNL